jgi:hypothetical protein
MQPTAKKLDMSALDDLLDDLNPAGTRGDNSVFVFQLSNDVFSLVNCKLSLFPGVLIRIRQKAAPRATITLVSTTGLFDDDAVYVLLC